MYKVLLEYEKINKNMKLKFGLILSDGDKKFNNKVLDKFTIDGADYLKVSPHPFLTIDISTREDKGGNWSSNRSVTLTTLGIFILKKKLKKALESLATEDLFMYYDNKLMLNKDLAVESTVKTKLGNKYVMIQPIVVPDEENPAIEYEGLCFMINSVDNFNLMTIDEAEFLLDRLENVDLMNLALTVINTAMLMKAKTSVKLDVKSNKLITEEASKENVEVNFTNKKEESTIPNI